MCHATQTEFLPCCSLQTPLRGAYVSFSPPLWELQQQLPPDLHLQTSCTDSAQEQRERRALEAEMMMFGSKLQEATEEHHPQRFGRETARAPLNIQLLLP